MTLNDKQIKKILKRLEDHNIGLIDLDDIGGIDIKKITITDEYLYDVLKDVELNEKKGREVRK